MIIEKYNQRAKKINSLLCVGLDSEFEKIPDRFKTSEMPPPASAMPASNAVATAGWPEALRAGQFEFNKWIIEQTHEYVASYKLNIAFYEARGDQGIKELKETMEYLKVYYPDIFTICDCKRADIGNTNQGYVTSLFDWYGFDAVTLHPYLGREAMQPFLDRADKGCIILCRTSNPGAGEFQDLMIPHKLLKASVPLWHIVAEEVRDNWNKNKNCMLVVGATYPEEMGEIRKLVGDMTFLVPGIGAQGGDLAAVMKAGLNSAGLGLIIHSARGIIFAIDPKSEARKLCEEIRKYKQ